MSYRETFKAAGWEERTPDVWTKRGRRGEFRTGKEGFRYNFIFNFTEAELQKWLDQTEPTPETVGQFRNVLTIMLLQGWKDCLRKDQAGDAVCEFDKILERADGMVAEIYCWRGELHAHLMRGELATDDASFKPDVTATEIVLRLSDMESELT